MTTTVDDQARLTTTLPAILQQNGGSGVSLNTTKVEIELNAEQDNSATSTSELDKRQRAQQHYEKLQARLAIILAYADINTKLATFEVKSTKEQKRTEKIVTFHSDSE